MKKTAKFNNVAVANKFSQYPDTVRPKMLDLRQLVLDTAQELNKLEDLEETLKWEEPSYLAKGGSTIRMDWKAGKPNQYALYFICTTKLVDTFREVYGESLSYEGNRALVFSLKKKLPRQEVKHCIRMALDYHRLKKLPLLGG